jgi:hypothetical protein
MRKRLEPFLRPACLILAVLVLWQLVGIVRRANPLRGVTVPPLPALAATTNSISTGVPSVSSKMSTNATTTIGTNTVVKTNSMTVINHGTNSSSFSPTNSEHTDVTPVLSPTTNVVSTVPGTNQIVKQVSSLSSSNLIVRTNKATAQDVSNGTNANSTGKMLVPSHAGRMAMPSRGGRGAKLDNLPPAIQAQITKIIDSEMLGPVPHPLPMALMGIAGDVAFLRSPSGQTGVVKIGDTLGEIKLVRIGTNRVLVEQDGEQKELTIFDGYGGTSLLEKQGGTNNETHN